MFNSGATTKINILTLTLSEKTILNETKNHNPPPHQVKWSVPNMSLRKENIFGLFYSRLSNWQTLLINLRIVITNVVVVFIRKNCIQMVFVYFAFWGLQEEFSILPCSPCFTS